MATFLSAGSVGIPAYWQDAKDELMKRDRILRKLIPQFGDMHLMGRGEAFNTLARAIISQQISIKAAGMATRLGSLSEMYAAAGTQGRAGHAGKLRHVKTQGGVRYRSRRPFQGKARSCG